MVTDDPEQRPSVVVVDDHPLWRGTLRALLEHGSAGRVVGEAADGESAVAVVADEKPDVVVMDMHLPGMNGAVATAQIIETSPATKVLVLSSSDERASVLEAVRAGASGYLLKTADADEVNDALLRVHRGELVFPPALASIVLEELRSHGRDPARPLRVALVADSPLDREGLARLVGDAGCEASAHASPADVPAADVVVAVAPGRDARERGEMIRSLRETIGLATPFVVLADDVDPAAAEAVIVDESAPAGVGYVLRSRVEDVASFVESLHRVAAGERVIDADIAQALVAPKPQPSVVDDLTDREREVLALMAEGRSNQGIAERLFVSSKSVESYVARIFTKLGLEVEPDDHRRVLAVVAYLKAGQP